MTSESGGSEPDIEPDTKDWTWVLDQPCPACGFDAVAMSHTDVAAGIRQDADHWVIRLSGDAVSTRPTPHRVVDPGVRLPRP